MSDRRDQLAEYKLLYEQKLISEAIYLEKQRQTMGLPDQGPPSLPDGAQLLQQSMVLPPALPSAEGYKTFLLTDCQMLRIPVTQEAADFIHGTGHEIGRCFVAATKPLLSASYLLGDEYISSPMTEDKTTNMMAMLFEWFPKAIYKALPLESACRVESFDATGNKTEQTRSNPSTALSKKGQRPDRLCFIGGATALIGEDKGEGDMAHALLDMSKYCEAGFLPYHYGTVYMLPTYAAAGSQVYFGHYLQSGKVEWDFQISMLSPVERGVAVLVVIQISRWWARMESLLPPMAHRIKLLEADHRGFVTIYHKSREVHKIIDDFDEFVAGILPGTKADIHFEIIKSIYQRAREQTDEQRFMAKPTSLPSLSRRRRYIVKLQAYGLPANPQTLQHFWALLRSLCLTAETLHSLGYVMRDFRQPNVLTRDNGQEGAYVTIDFEFAGLANAYWTGPGLADWDEQTLEQDGTYSFLSDMHQISVLMTRLPAWSEHSSDVELSQFVGKLSQKEFTAQAALQNMPENYSMHR